MDAVERAVLNDIEMHDNGCWTWRGSRFCNIIRLLAELLGTPLPANIKLYRTPDCELGSECVRLAHVCTYAECVAQSAPSHLPFEPEYSSAKQSRTDQQEL